MRNNVRLVSCGYWLIKHLRLVGEAWAARGGGGRPPYQSRSEDARAPVMDRRQQLLITSTRTSLNCEQEEGKQWTPTLAETAKSKQTARPQSNNEATGEFEWSTQRRAAGFRATIARRRVTC